jgi:NADH dehydrogenase
VIEGCDIIFNLIGVLYESKTSSFNFAHNEIPIMIGKCARKNKVRSLIHISALNVNKITNSNYAYSKSLGEAGIKKHFPEAIIVRPGVVFGKGDNFTNFFCNMSKFSPFLPLIGTPKIDLSKNLISIFNFKKRVKFQPLYVGDLSKFLINVTNKKNKIYDLAGPSVLSFNEIFDLILNFKKRKRLYIPVPFFEAKILAFFLEFFPKPLLTRDQINLLQHDSVSSKGLSNLKSVVKNPEGIETAISKYL